MTRTMKESGIDWIGQIPENWETSKIGQIYSERNEKVSDYDYEPLSVTMQGVVSQLSTAAKSDAHDDRKLVKKGDFAINSRSDRRGSCGISPKDGSVSLINTILKPNKDMNPDYYNWVFHSTMFSDEFYKWGHGIVNDLWTTRWQDMKKISIPSPQLDEQEKIACFLEEKCASIDTVIENTKASIDEYKKLKQAVITKAVTKGIRPNRKYIESGVEWIGTIPEEWKHIKMKYCSWLKGRIGWDGLKSTEYTEEGPYLITGVDFENGLINWDKCVHITEERFQEDELLHIFEGDLLITKDGTVGKVAIAKDCPEKVSLNSGVLLIRNDRNYKYHDKYMYYTLLSDEFWLWYVLNQTGQSTIKHLYQEQFYDFEFAYPPIEEQLEISIYLDNECSKIDNIIENHNKIIDEYLLLRKSMIFEYVTGKKEVPDCY